MESNPEEKMDQLFRKKLTHFDQSPPMEIWEGIKKEAFTKSTRTFQWYAVAASVLLLMGIIATILFYREKEPVEELVIKPHNQVNKPIMSISKNSANTSAKPSTLPPPIAKKETNQSEKSEIAVSTESQKKDILLADGSHLYLAPFSSIRFSENNHNRSLKLNGEVFFKIKKDPQRPFIISSTNTITSVLGTTFLIRSLSGIDEIFVFEGSVLFSNKQETKKVVLSAGQTANSSNFKLADSFDKNILAWKNEKLEFDNTPLTEVCTTLEHYFKVTIKIENAQISACSFTGTFNKPSLPGILEMLKQSSGIHYQKKDNTYILKGTSCN